MTKPRDGDGEATIEVGAGSFAVTLATEYGPRIIGLTPDGGPNLMADLGELGIDLGRGEKYVFRGGHRLWVAPEVPSLTYRPDLDPVVVTRSDSGVLIEAPDRVVHKAIAVEVGLDEASVGVMHTITNAGDSVLDVAPWAITQLRTGGVAMLPLDRRPADKHRLQASHHIVGWPYTDWAAITYGTAGSVASIAGTRTTPTKFGTSLARGWLAYVLDGWLFAKHAAPTLPATVDLGAQAQIFANEHFVELETLGATVPLEPGASVRHRETWKVWPAPDSLDDVPSLVESWSEELAS